MSRQLRSPRFNNVLDVPGASGTVTNSTTLTGRLRVSLNPALSDGYAEPIQQPLKSRVPKRQQPNYADRGKFLVTSSTTTTIGGQLGVSLNPALSDGYAEPIQQPLRSRVPRRQQPNYADRGKFLITVSGSTTLGGQLRVSTNPSLSPVWVHPTNQPLKARVPKRQQVNRVQRSQFLVTTSTSTTLTGQLRVSSNPANNSLWKRPNEQPLRSRVPKRSQVRTPFVFVPTTGTGTTTLGGQLRVSANPSLEPVWVHPTNQPLKGRIPKRLQVNRVTKDKFLVTATSSTTLNGQLRISLNPATTAGWKQAVNEPLRSRVPKRQQPAYPTLKFLVSTVPITNITGQLRVSSNPANLPVWKQPTNQPLKARVPKRLQLPRPTRGDFLVTVVTSTTLTGQLRVSTNPSLVPVWKQPVNEPIRSRVPKRQQPAYPILRFLAATTPSATLTGQLRISANPSIEPLWKAPVNQPLKSRVPKRLQVNRVLRGDFLVTASRSTTITGQLRISGNPATKVTLWKQPVNEPLRKRVPKRQMPKSIPSKFLPLQTVTVTSTITGRLRIVASTSLWVPEGNPTNAFQGSTDTTSALWQNQANPNTGFTGNANPSTLWQEVDPETLEWH